MDKYTIADIKAIFQSSEIEESLLLKLEKDKRLGVKKILGQYYKALDKKVQLLEDHNKRLAYEHKLLENQDIKHIAGIDEVGRGPLAGPVVAASVILNKDTDGLIGINDSKKLTKTQRESFAKLIKKEAAAYSIAIIDNSDVDKYNVLEASKLAMLKSVNELPIKPQHLLVDAMTLDLDISQTSLIEGDQKSLSIAAASILAKVHRDQLMEEYAKHYPEFGFERNMGYGTKEHLQALNQYGYTPIHRLSFAPVQKVQKKYEI